MNTDIYLVDFNYDKGFHFSNLRNITKHKGYDNQPWFSPDGKSVYYTSMTADSTTDIFKHDLKTGKFSGITRTDGTSEYSPQLTPDGKHISVVRVEEDGFTQRIWMFDLNGKKPRNPYPWLDSVGYYQWANDTILAAFILGPNEEHTLRLVDVKHKSEIIIGKKVGRSFHFCPEQECGNPLSVRFMQKNKQNEMMIYLYNFITKEVYEQFVPLEKSQDMVQYGSLRYFMSDGSKLYSYWGAAKFAHWSEVKEFSFPNISGITRLAISPDKKTLAFVAADSGE
jgi:WD40 repeat protein